MRVAAIYDIHGNLPALEAVLEEVRRAEVDAVVVGGDVVPGPMPLATLRRLDELELPVHPIHGNGEIAVAAVMAGREVPYQLPRAVLEGIEWTARQLETEYLSRFEEWPRTLTLDVEGLGEVLFCHATPRDENEIFTRRTRSERLLPVLAEVEARTVVCGHTHMQFDRRVGQHRVVNAGSVGMPFGAPGAYWLLLGPNIELRRTEYDLAAAVGLVEASDYPQTREWAEGVLEPRSEEEMLHLFAAAELR